MDMNDKHPDKVDKYGDLWKWVDNRYEDDDGNVTGGYAFAEDGDWYKHDFGDRIYWRNTEFGDLSNASFDFTFDKKKVFNLYTDYPMKLTAEQRNIFKKENPELAAEFTEDRFDPPSKKSK